MHMKTLPKTYCKHIHVLYTVHKMDMRKRIKYI